MKRKKPGPDTQCGHMPFNTVSRKAMFKAAYEPESILDADEKKLKAILLNRAEKMGATGTEQLPEFFLSLQHCCWTEADMSDVSWDNLSREAKIAIQFCKENYNKFNKRWSYRHCGNPIAERSSPEGIYYLIPGRQWAEVDNPNKAPYLYGNYYLTRVLIKVDGKMEVGQTISVNENIIEYVRLSLGDFLDFFANPVHHITCYKMERLISEALKLHPEWYPPILNAITDVGFVFNGSTPQSRYTEIIDKALQDKLALSVHALSEVHRCIIGRESGTVEFNKNEEK